MKCCIHCHALTDAHLCVECIQALPTPLLASVAAGTATALDCDRWLRERRRERKRFAPRVELEVSF
ncbi:MAG: hypothetical protein DI536_04150 [Archangium gephyra]|uniref:Uncharacterized protein n=1 Tax=Archangium gephyra TaxID=48 RepID=A0A2W5TSD1_9BACT|nr:MAG: hypothetical protein DI536_04150 [Archangium gephyra]